MPASQTRSVSYRIGEAASGGMGAISQPANQSESGPGHFRPSSAGVAYRTLPLSPKSGYSASARFMMGWTPPDGIGVPKVEVLSTT